MTINLSTANEFIARHIGPRQADEQAMLATLGFDSLEGLSASVIPESIKGTSVLGLEDGMSEAEALARIKAIASQNQLFKTYIGQGYYNCHTPSPILRNLLENPAWYTAYTPYQPEISQGRLEALLNFQTLISDLTGLPIANASLLDEATAAAEAMTFCKRLSKNKGSHQFFASVHCHPQTLDVLRTRAEPLGIEVVVGDERELSDVTPFFGALLQYPASNGDVFDYRALTERFHAANALVAVAADLLALTLLTPPGEFGADVAIGSAQRFGVPLGFGGPHAAFFACRDEYKRAMPGRIIGVSIDANGGQALRMALQTREQHIRREKANSNICTSQVLLANMAGLYAVYHGEAGIRRIAGYVHRLANLFAAAVRIQGGTVINQSWFDTVLVATGPRTDAVLASAEAAGYTLRRVDNNTIGVAFHEAASRADVAALAQLFTGQPADIDALDASVADTIPASLARSSRYLTHPVFNTHHSETEMLRYLKRLQNRDLALDHSMISLGSCTMKLNATSEMIPVTWPEFAGLHPFAPREHAAGYLAMIDSLSEQLKAITGFDAICMQPNSGAQGEYAGLLAIRRYHASRGDAQRTVCLIPKSAHGTNPATAQMMGMQVVVVACDDNGNVDVADLKAKAEQYSATLACLMITYPSTHGVFEEAMRDICDTIHAHGGQVYMDGANLNALVGLVQPGKIGADVSHMNLHKTFCIPHGGGGPGMGPIGLKAHLAPFMANHSVTPIANGSEGQSAVSAAPFGSASILPISWMYIRMMGAAGLKRATQVALLNANYVATRLQGAFPVLYTGKNGRVAHECIIDLRPLKAATGVTEVDVAKRLMDYGFHAPTMSFPVAGTIMIEPTESESKAELDRFIDALLSIRAEIAKVEAGEWAADSNPLKHAPHTQSDVISREWSRAYSRDQAVFPLEWVRDNKFWPSVNRIDDVYGDRNLMCSCPGMENYQ